MIPKRFTPVNRMEERLRIAKEDSDTAYYDALLLMAEFVTKLTTAALLSAVKDDRDRLRYRHAYKLVRSDSIGDWVQTLDEILTGPASQFFDEIARVEGRELTEKVKSAWQSDAVELLHRCYAIADSEIETLPAKNSLTKWFQLFASLRNKTKGHGAPLATTKATMIPLLEKSITLLITRFSLFGRSWAYLHRNLSGKYRVISLSEDISQFNYLKSDSDANFNNGIHVYFSEPRHVELFFTDVDLSDFFLPNGNYKPDTFELLSYITGVFDAGNSKIYSTPATPLPQSETAGIGKLDVVGECFGNIPPRQQHYIRRQELESEVKKLLLDDHHPIISLVGRGGIGKTSLAITALHTIAEYKRFDLIVWFSARDIDLLDSGPKIVRPNILSEKDIAEEFARLTEPQEARDRSFKPLEYLSKMMNKSILGPILFVFDNFETVKGPSDLYHWIDNQIRSPNKVLITSRLREFKGDYPIEVLGMNAEEFRELVLSMAKTLKIEQIITGDYIAELHRETDGHPYVAKILLGESAKSKRLIKVERFMSDRDDILTPLFERSYEQLSPAAKRVFLTLCNWRSSIPLLALEAVILRPANERIDVAAAIEDLLKSSLIEANQSTADGEIFINVPLITSVFGSGKLTISHMKTAIDADTEMLRNIGAAQRSEIKRGIEPRIYRMFKSFATKFTQSPTDLKKHISMLEYIAAKFPRAWLMLAELYEEISFKGWSDDAKNATLRYIESIGPRYSPEKFEAWKKYYLLCARDNDFQGQLNAQLQLTELPDTPFYVISEAVNKINSLIGSRRVSLPIEERDIIMQNLIQKIEPHIHKADATDLSRLAWLYLSLQNEKMAKEIAAKGLEKDPSNRHCTNIIQRIDQDYKPS